MEQEFSVKEILFYCLRRWYIFVLAAVLFGVAGVALFFTGGNKKEIVRYETTATICNLETFTKESGLVEQELIIASWDEQTRRAMDAMWFGHNIRNFTESTENAALTDKLAKGANRTEFLSKRLRHDGKSYQIVIGYETSDTKESAADITNLLNAYAAFVRARALEDAVDLGKMNPDDAIVLTAAVYDSTTVIKGSVVESSAYWVIGGIAVGAVLVLALYYIDPKLKSAREVERYGFPVLAKIPDAKIGSEELAPLLTGLAGTKNICVSEPDGTRLSDFCASLTACIAATGNRVLWLDARKTEDGAGRFRDYLFGAELARCVTQRNGIDKMTFTDAGDVLSLSTRKERFDALSATYDKIIISVDASVPGSVAAVAAHCDSVICVLDKRIAKTAHLKYFCAGLGDSVKRVGAILYGCKE